MGLQSSGGPAESSACPQGWGMGGGCWENLSRKSRWTSGEIQFSEKTDSWLELTVGLFQKQRKTHVSRGWATGLPLGAGLEGGAGKAEPVLGVNPIQR